MTHFDEKRKFRRFEIPGGEAKYNERIMLPHIHKTFSKSYPVLNICIGGLALLCEERFNQDEKLIIQLSVPKEDVLDLRLTVKWQEPVALSTEVIVGFEFMEFSNSKGWNSPDTLNVLRRLYARYSGTP